MRSAEVAKGRELVKAAAFQPVGGGSATVSNKLHEPTGTVEPTSSQPESSAPAAPAIPDAPMLTNEQLELRRQITEIYKYYRGKDSLSELPLLFERFNGREREVLLDLEKQYPATRRASAMVGFDMYGSEDDKKQEGRESENQMKEFKDALKVKREIWLYLDGDSEMGPFSVEEMRERLKDGRFNKEMQIKMTHWTSFYAIKEVWPVDGEELSFSPLEPGAQKSVTASSTSSGTATHSHALPRPSVGMAPRPMATRKGSMLPVAPPLPLVSAPPSTPAHAPPPVPTETAASPPPADEPVSATTPVVESPPQ